MRLNLDIWYEIVNYFGYPEDEDILMSLAVTSRCLSDLALDVVWRSGRNNSNIVPVINSFAPSQDEPFLVCSYDNPDEYPEDMEFEGSSSSIDYLIGSWVSFNFYLNTVHCENRTRHTLGTEWTVTTCRSSPCLRISSTHSKP